MHYHYKWQNKLSESRRVVNSESELQCSREQMFVEVNALGMRCRRYQVASSD
jgi:hypothetical protein